MASVPSFDDLLAVMAAAASGDKAARVRILTLQAAKTLGLFWLRLNEQAPAPREAS
jgi:hypothetical protein